MTEEILVANYFDESVKDVLDELFANQIYPIVYAYINGIEKFSFVSELCTIGMNKFIHSRQGDIRTNAVTSMNDLKYATSIIASNSEDGFVHWLEQNYR